MSKRGPFIWFLIVLSLYCWLKDVVNFFFYLFHITGPWRDTAGSFTGILGVLAFLYVIKTTIYKDLSAQRRQEWLILLLVSLPVILLGLFRSLYPDLNFDTIHFELYLQDYDLSENKINFAAGSIRTYYFPLSERIFGLCRHLLGYRLGALLNTFLLVAIIASAYDFIKQFLGAYCRGVKAPVIWVALLSLFAVFADNALFNIGSYKPDLIGVPILMELLHIVFFDKGVRKRSGHLIFFGLVSLVIAYKLTYLPYAAVLAAVYYGRYFNKYGTWEKVLYPLSVLLIPAIYLQYNFMETGSPIFPFYNKIFHSGLYPDSNFKDERYGPAKLYEIFIFPIVTWLTPSRCNPWNLYSYRLLAGYFVSLFTIGWCFWCLLRKKATPFLRPLLFLALTALLFDYLCIVTTGYYRYGIIVEVLYGFVLGVEYLCFRRTWMGYLLLLVMLLQSLDTFRNIYVRQSNLSWHDYRALLHDKRAIKNNAALLFRDYDQIRDPDAVLPAIDAFVNVAPCPMDGLARLLNKNVPIWDLLNYSRTPELMNGFEQNVVRVASQTKNLVTVTNGYNLTGIFAQLNAQGYLVTEIHQIYPRFMRAGEPVFLLKIKYLDTSRYIIRFTGQDIRNENPPATRSDFTYRSSDTLKGWSPDTLKVFIMEAPYTYDWLPSAKASKISLNGHIFALSDAREEDGIYSIEDNHLQFGKSGDVPFSLLIQEKIKK